MKGVIIAAGYGTRFLPGTKTIPKEMFPLVNKPAIAFIIEEFAAAGIRDVLIVTSRRKKALDDYFDREIELETVFLKEGRANLLAAIAPPDMSILFARQQAMRGTGDALLLAEAFAAGGPICVAYPDDLVLGADPLAAQLMRASTGPDECVLGVMPVPRQDVCRYGIIAPGRDMRVESVIEKPPVEKAPSELAIIGRFILPSAIFPLLHAERDKNPAGEFYHIDPVNILARAGKVRYAPFTGMRLDVGEPLGYVKATIEYALTMPECGKELLAWLKERSA